MAGDLFEGDLVRHETHGIGKVEETSGMGENQRCLVYFPRTDKRSFFGRSTLTRLAPSEVTSYEMVKLAVRELREEDAPVVEMADRWKGGELVLQPTDSSLAPKSLPVETFFHKIVMVRDRLRVLEQQINSHKKLSDEEKVGLQQYITRIYGSLTTFNVLFRHKKDHFVGQKGEK